MEENMGEFESICFLFLWNFSWWGKYFHRGRIEEIYFLFVLLTKRPSSCFDQFLPRQLPADAHYISTQVFFIIIHQCKGVHHWEKVTKIADIVRTSLGPPPPRHLLTIWEVFFLKPFTGNLRHLAKKRMFNIFAVN